MRNVDLPPTSSKSFPPPKGLKSCEKCGFYFNMQKRNKKKYVFDKKQRAKFVKRVMTQWRRSAAIHKKVLCSECNVVEVYDKAVHKIVFDHVQDAKYEFRSKPRWICIKANKKAPESVEEWRKRLFG